MGQWAMDWLRQAERDLEQAEDSRRAGRHEWACFAAQQAAEKAVQALHLHHGQEAWGHVIARLLRDLPPTVPVPEDLVEKARVLDNFYIPPRFRTATRPALLSSITALCRARRPSAARGDWGVGSDLDLVVIVRHATLPFERRAAAWDTTEIPVPVDLLVYTEEGWKAMDPAGRFRRTLDQETVWVYTRPAG